MQNEYLPALLEIVELEKKQVPELFGSLTTEQLSWKPDANEWSVGQCIDHILVTNSRYFAILEKIISGEKKTSFWERLSILPGFWGRLLVRAVHPRTSRKIKTSEVFKPREKVFSQELIKNFVEHQGQLVDLMNRTDHLNHKRIVVTSPAAKFITYSLKDCFRIIVYHEQRHIAQAIRVSNMPEFPKE